MPWEGKNRLETYYPRVREALPDFTVSGFLAIPLYLSACYLYGRRWVHGWTDWDDAVYSACWLVGGGGGG